MGWHGMGLTMEKKLWAARVEAGSLVKRVLESLALRDNDGSEQGGGGEVLRGGSVLDVFGRWSQRICDELGVRCGRKRRVRGDPRFGPEPLGARFAVY